MTTVGEAQEWELPEVSIGDLPHSELRFAPDSIVAPYVRLSKVSDSPLVYKVSYASDLSIFAING